MYNTLPDEKFLALRLLQVVVLILFGACAGQRPPQGGPPDTTPPEILRSEPPPGATNVRANTIRLQFSEYVDRRSLEQSVFVSPPVGRLAFDWSGTEVEITIPETLRTGTTYIFSVGTDVVDLRNKNNMAATFALPFSTGDRIDSGKISGRVYDPNAGGVFVYAYLLADGRGDTLSPSRTKPDFVSQTGTAGTFTLTNLPLGTFRLVAVRDELRNLLYDVQADAYGVLPADVTLAAGAASVAGVTVQMTREDTGRPFLTGARPVHRTLTLLRFSEPVDPATVVADSVEVTDTMSGATAGVLDAAPDHAAPSQLMVATEPLDTLRGYRVTVSGVRDLFGNAAASDSAAFSPAPSADTAELAVDLSGIADSSTDVAPDDTLLFTFGRPVRREPFERGLSVVTAQGARVAGSFVWLGSAAVRFVPEAPLSPGVMYTARIFRDSVRSAAGRAMRESVWVRSFRVVDDRRLSSLSGSVVDSGAAGSGPAVVTATLADPRAPRSRSTVAGEGGAFSFPLLPEGKYVVTAFRDADGNGRYSYGLPFPFRASERFTVYEDSLKLRARWPVEGVTIRLR